MVLFDRALNGDELRNNPILSHLKKERLTNKNVAQL